MTKARAKSWFLAALSVKADGRRRRRADFSVKWVGLGKNGLVVDVEKGWGRQAANVPDILHKTTPF
jgi:hypothetical protein